MIIKTCNWLRQIFTREGKIDITPIVKPFVANIRSSVTHAELARGLELYRNEIMLVAAIIIRTDDPLKIPEYLIKYCTSVKNQAEKILMIHENSLHVCIKIFQKNKIITLARSIPEGTRSPLVGKSHSRILRLSTVACSLLDAQDDTEFKIRKVDAVSCPNIVKAKKTKAYRNTRGDANDHFLSTFVLPLTIDGLVIGELAFDSPAEAAFKDAPNIIDFRLGKISWEEYHVKLNSGECSLFYSYAQLISKQISITIACNTLTYNKLYDLDYEMKIDTIEKELR